MQPATQHLGLVAAPAFEARLGFAPPARVAPDAARGLLRAEPMPVGDEASYVELRSVRVRDLARPEADVLGLARSGFDVTRLDGVRGLAARLDAVEAAGELTEPMARAIRRALWNAVLPLEGGGTARILFVAPEGTIHRHAGPAGRSHRPELVPTATTHHGPASNLHVDQDVRGTPLRQWLLRLAPWIFAHEAPDSVNRRSRIRLLNLWIPLQQVTRPLVLVDARSYDRRAHQALYALPVESFLDRGRGTSTNDIWAVLPGEGQRFYCHAGLQRGQAWVFDTLSAPHASFVLPGEERVAALGDEVAAVCARLRARDVGGAARLAVAALARPAAAQVETSEALVGHASTLLDVLHRAAACGAAAGAPGEGARADAIAALAAEGEATCAGLVRRSIELRAVAYVSPR